MKFTMSEDRYVLRLEQRVPSGSETRYRCCLLDGDSILCYSACSLAGEGRLTLNTVHSRI